MYHYHIRFLTRTFVLTFNTSNMATPHVPIARLLSLSATDMRLAIPVEELAAALASLPFIANGRLLNLRDMGSVPGSSVRPGRIFRSGWLRQDNDTADWLGSHVKVVFDLRGGSEAAARPDPVAPGVENVWAEHAAPGADLPIVTAAHFGGDGTAGWGTQYLIYTRTLAPVFRAVLQHVRDQPRDPFLFHCTAGRDRSGVLAGLLHHLAGSPPEAVEADYLLSRVGIEPHRAGLNGYIHRWLEVADPDAPAHVNAATLRVATWRAFLDGIHRSYGGWDAYVTGHLGFSVEDLATIRLNLQAD
jgi:hypothetical protein